MHTNICYRINFIGSRSTPLRTPPCPSFPGPKPHCCGSVVEPLLEQRVSPPRRASRPGSVGACTKHTHPGEQRWSSSGSSELLWTCKNLQEQIVLCWLVAVVRKKLLVSRMHSLLRETLRAGTSWLRWVCNAACNSDFRRKVCISVQLSFNMKAQQSCWHCFLSQSRMRVTSFMMLVLICARLPPKTSSSAIGLHGLVYMINWLLILWLAWVIKVLELNLQLIQLT